MNILVLANAFEQPNNNMRLRTQCDEFVRLGHHVEVYTEPWDDIDFPHEYPIHEIGDIHSNFVKWLFMSIYSMFTNYKERRFAYKILWDSRKQDYDIVFCSTNSCFPLGAAAIVAKRKQLPLHVDICDMTELIPKKKEKNAWTNPFDLWQKHLYKRRRNRAIRSAVSVTTASPQHAALLKQINPNTTLIYNGFDPNIYYYQDTQTDMFRINYIGQMHRSQKTELILKVMNELKTELPKIHWTFYCNHLVYNHLNRLRPDVRGMLPEEVIGDTLRQTSILIMVNDTLNNGIQSEHFYSALGCEKPIIFTAATEGMVPDMIRFTNSGISAVDTESIKDFIRTYYQQWEKQGFTHQHIENKDLFNVEKQAEVLLGIFEQAIR